MEKPAKKIKFNYNHILTWVDGRHIAGEGFNGGDSHFSF